MRPHLLIAARTAIGFMQGAALYLLYRTVETKAWPATDGSVFAPLLFIAAFIPPIALLGLGNMRLRTLIGWVGLAAILVAGLAIYDISRNPGDAGILLATTGVASSRLVPSLSLWLFAGAGLFIAHTLIAAADNDGRIIANYPRYFDLSWKYAVQHILAIIFVGIFWALLWLGAELFRLISIEFFREIIKKPWFAVPITALAFAYAIHVTDIRAGLVRGMRTLVLTLLSWLLPMMALFAVGFLLALPFTGLEPLWNTRRATAVLLIAAAALVILINAAYQDGQPETSVPRALRYAALATAVTLVPLVAIAAYGLWLRVDQYGWTPDRIIALACIVVAACYACGYLLAAARLGTWLKWLETTNVFTAFVVLAVLLALFTPVADPARISVADQVRRLESGAVAVDQFDFAFLRFGGGRYGQDALERLKRKEDGPNAVQISTKANEALDWRNRWDVRRQLSRMTSQARAANIAVVHPDGQTLPDSFLRHEWSSAPNRGRLPACLVTQQKCEAILSDLDSDGKPEVLLFSVPGGASAVFKAGTDNTWAFVGTVTNVQCAGVREALRSGQFQVVQPSLLELDVKGQRLRIATDCGPTQLQGPIRIEPAR